MYLRRLVAWLLYACSFSKGWPFFFFFLIFYHHQSSLNITVALKEPINRHFHNLYSNNDGKGLNSLRKGAINVHNIWCYQYEQEDLVKRKFKVYQVSTCVMNESNESLIFSALLCNSSLYLNTSLENICIWQLL